MSGKWLIASRKRRLINGHCASRSRHRVSGRHEHPQEYISDDACAVEDGQCDERNPNPCHADAQVQGDDVILLLCRAQGVAAGVLPGVQGTIRVFPERCGSGRAV